MVISRVNRKFVRIFGESGAHRFGRSISWDGESYASIESGAIADEQANSSRASFRMAR
jgi:hypothetical protein